MAYINSVQNIPKVGDTVTSITITKDVVPTFPDGVPKYTGSVLIEFSNGYRCTASTNFKDEPVNVEDLEAFLVRQSKKSE